MSETANQSYSHFLDERAELRGAYSSLLLSKEAATRQYHGKAKDIWRDREEFNGIDDTMWNFTRQFLKPGLVQEADEMVTELVEGGYGHKRDITMVSDAVKRFSASHVPNAYHKPKYKDMLRLVADQVKPTHWLTSIEFNTVESLREFLSNPKASAGAFACYSIAKKKKDVLTKKMLDLLYELELRAVKQGSMKEPTLPGIRLQTSIPLDDFGQLAYREVNGKFVLDFKFKTRLINMVSMPRIFQEMHYSVSVQAEFGKMSWYAGGKIPEEIFQTMCRNRMKFSRWDSLDYSAYDQSLPGWFIRDAFNIIKGWFSFRDDFDQSRWDVMVNDFIHKGLVSDRAGNIVSIHDGVESGSMFTQIIDTLCNYMMMSYYCLLHEKVLGKDCVCNICGDDNIVFHNGWFNGVEYLNCIRKVFGVRGNAQKSQLGKVQVEDPEYLSRVWRWHGVYRFWKELLIKLIFHERRRDYTDEVTPELIFKAYVDTYPLGMAEGFDIGRFYSKYPNCTRGSMSEKAVKAVGGIVAYEFIYGRKRYA